MNFSFWPFLWVWFAGATPEKGGFVCHILGVRMPYFCRNPLILTDFYAIQTPIVWHILGAYFFLQIWGVGVVRIIFRSCQDFFLQIWGVGVVRIILFCFMGPWTFFL